MIEDVHALRGSSAKGTFTFGRNLGKNPPLENNTRRKQQFQQAMLQAFENPEFNFEKFKKGLNKTKHDLNKLAKQKDLLKEIYKIESKGK